MMQFSDLPTLNWDLKAGSKVVVAMSGGVDSSVAAALAHQAGFETIGITMQLYDHGRAVQKKNACCAGQDIYDARNVAANIGIPHYVLDYENRFRQAVIDDFALSYSSGKTPIPCVRCNQSVKFTDLLGFARDLGAQALITGHYARRLKKNGSAELHQATDPEKDQSYFLFATSEAQLDFVRFPLGNLHKEQTRNIAKTLGLPVAQKPESQDICFIPEGHYTDLVARLKPGSLMPGDIVHTDGRTLGRHDGVINYTVGQRRGLKIAVGEPLYVIAIDEVAHKVVVGPKKAALEKQAHLENTTWLCKPESLKNGLMIRLGHNEKPVPGYFNGDLDHPAVIFDEPVFAVAPGQACVLYQGTRILGGGWIAKRITAENKTAKTSGIHQSRLTQSTDKHKSTASA